MTKIILQPLKGIENRIQGLSMLYLMLRTSNTHNNIEVHGVVASSETLNTYDYSYSRFRYYYYFSISAHFSLFGDSLRMLFPLDRTPTAVYFMPTFCISKRFYAQINGKETRVIETKQM